MYKKNAKADELIGEIDVLAESMTEDKKARFYANLTDVLGVMLMPAQDLDANASIIPDSLNLSSEGS